MKTCKPLLAVFLAAATLAAAPAEARREAKMYAVTTWDAGCGGSARSWWDDMADAWYDEITDSGFSMFGWCLWGHCSDYYSRSGRQVNGNIVNSQFTDAAVVAWGNDQNHMETADAVLAAWHGGESGNVYQGSMRVDEAGSGNCTLRRDEMRIGNQDLEFLHLSSCQSMDDNQWSTWWQAMNRMHQVDGFHGFMWIGSGHVDDYRDFADDAFSSTIADAWLDNLYKSNFTTWNGKTVDQCPVAYAVGINSDDTWNRIGSERYNHVHADPASIGYWGVVFISGCNPANETEINTDWNN